MFAVHRTLLSSRGVSTQVGLCCFQCLSHLAPILKEEVLHYLDVGNKKTILDMTFGSGLHAESILKCSNDTTLIALDRDPHSFTEATCLANIYPGRVIPLLGCFSDLPTLLQDINIQPESLDGVLLHVGCSDFQLAQANRGFSPNLDGALDMRMDCDRIPNSVTAADVLAKCDELDLHKIFRIYGGEEVSKKLARAIVQCRYQFHSLKTSFEFRDFIHESFSSKVSVKSAFYALRTFVNNEINELNYGLLLAQKYLKTGGKIVTITNNHIEDLVVKRHLTGLVFENNPTRMNLKYYTHSLNLSPEEIDTWRKSAWVPLIKHVITVQDNMHTNHSSAKLRAAFKAD